MKTKKWEINVEDNGKGKITWAVSNYGFTALELLGLLELKKADIIEQCINPQNFIHRRRYKDEDGEWNEVTKVGERNPQMTKSDWDDRPIGGFHDD